MTVAAVSFPRERLPPTTRHVTEADLLQWALARCDDVPSVEALLSRVLSDGLQIDDDGQPYRTRQLAARVGNLQIRVYTRDHDPPHFHVVGEGWDVRLSVIDCSPLDGEASLRRKDREAVVEWFFRCGGGARVRDLWTRAHGSGAP